MDGLNDLKGVFKDGNDRSVLGLYEVEDFEDRWVTGRCDEDEYLYNILGCFDESGGQSVLRVERIRRKTSYQRQSWYAGN